MGAAWDCGMQPPEAISEARLVPCSVGMGWGIGDHQTPCNGLPWN